MAGASPVQTQEDLVPPKPAAIGYRWAGVLLAPAVAVAVLLVLTGPAGLDVQTPESPGSSTLEPLTARKVVVVAAAVAVLGWLSAYLLERFMGARGRRIWLVAAVVVTILSLGAVLPLDISAGARWGLVILHLIVAAVLIPTLASDTPAEPLRRGNDPVPAHRGDGSDDVAHPGAATAHAAGHEAGGQADIDRADPDHQRVHEDVDPYADDPHEVVDPHH